MAFIKVIKPGMLTTVQDRGRFGYQQWGIPVAGAMDEYALRIANLLVGNQENEGCLELTMLGPTLEFLEEGLIALTGGDLGAQLNGHKCPLWQSFFVKKGDVLNFSGLRQGCRGYLAVAGGLDIPLFMGSKATYLRGKMGGLEGRALKVGDELKKGLLQGEQRAMTPLKAPAEYGYSLSDVIEARVVLGPQDDCFTAVGIKTFFNSEYKVTVEGDRMGYRLEGPQIQHQEGADIISDGIAIGSIQVPGHGFPIVMMADRQTTGGYTKIATVITPDLPKLAQAKPGDTVVFKAVSLEEAHDIYRKYEDKIKRFKERALPLRAFRLKINNKSYLVEVEEV